MSGWWHGWVPPARVARWLWSLHRRGGWGSLVALGTHWQDRLDVIRDEDIVAYTDTVSAVRPGTEPPYRRTPRATAPAPDNSSTAQSATRMTGS